MKTIRGAAFLLAIGAAGTPATPLRIAVVQMTSADHDIDANLTRATGFAEQAAARGAQFVLFPEFMATGSYLSFDTLTLEKDPR